MIHSCVLVRSRSRDCALLFTLRRREPFFALDPLMQAKISSVTSATVTEIEIALFMLQNFKDAEDVE